MKKKEFFLTLSSFLLVLISTGVIVLLTYKQLPAQKMQYQRVETLIRGNENVVPVEIARKAAIYEVKNSSLIKEWEEAFVSSDPPATFFDLYRNPTAYCFRVVKEKQYKGYITISASFNFYPLRHASTGAFPLDSLEYCKKYIKQKNGEFLEEYKLIYLGNTLYFISFFSSSGKITLPLSPTPGIVSQEGLESMQILFEQKGKEIGPKSMEEWKRYL